MSTGRHYPRWKRGVAVISLHFKHQRFKHALVYGNGERAEGWAREALAYAETHFPPDHRQVLQCRQDLANAQEKRENFVGAAEQTRLIAEARERTTGPTAKPTLLAWLSYGMLQSQMADLAGAEETYRSVIHTLSVAGQPDRLESLDARYLLAANVLEGKGEMDEARETMRDAVRGYRAKLGALHPQTLDAGFRLALHEALRAYSGKALEELRSFMAQYWRQSAVDNHRYAMARYLFGHTLCMVGRSIEAEETLRELHGKRLVEDWLPSAVFYQVGAFICLTLLDQGRPEDAEAFAEVELHRLRPDDLNRYALYPSLATARRLRGRPDEAETLLREGLAVVTKIYGADSRETIAWRLVLAEHFRTLKSPEAIEFTRLNVAIAGKHFGPESCHALSQRNYLAYSLIDAGLPGEAVDETRAVGEAYLRQGRARHPMAIGTRETMALALTRAGRPSEAEPIFRELLAGFEAIAVEEHRWCLETRLHFAEALRDMGKAAEAKEHAQQALTILVKLRGDKAPDVLKAQRILQSTSQ